MNNKPLYILVGAFLVISLVIVFGIMPGARANFSNNPEAAQTYVENNPGFINTATDGLLEISKVASWAPGVILFGGLILLVVVGYFGLGKLLKIK